jgi:hypothetical protein
MIYLSNKNGKWCLLQNKNAEICREFGLGQLYMERGA